MSVMCVTINNLQRDEEMNYYSKEGSGRTLKKASLIRILQTMKINETEGLGKNQEKKKKEKLTEIYCMLDCDI